MKQNTAEDRNYFADPDTALLDETAALKADRLSNARVLRTIGHALESYQIVTCDLTVDDDQYTIKGRTLPSENTERSLFQLVRQYFVKANATPRPDRFTHRIDLRYSLEDIRAMEDQVRDRRCASTDVPDPLGMSQLLRVVGGYMDKRGDEELLGVSIDSRWVTITHMSRDGRLLKTSRDIEFFYDLWVKMYLQRSSRPRVLPPIGSTVFIGDEHPGRSVSYLR